MSMMHIAGSILKVLTGCVSTRVVAHCVWRGILLTVDEDRRCNESYRVPYVLRNLKAESMPPLTVVLNCSLNGRR
jgi:hypothetical protein